MIRSLLRCTRLHRNLLATQTNCITPAINHISSSVGQITSSKRKNNFNQHIATEESKVHDSEDSQSNLDHGPMIEFIDFIHQKLNCSKGHAAQLCVAYPELLSETSDSTKNLELLLAQGVRPNVILDNPKMLSRSHGQLALNLNIVKDMKPKDINDFAPLVQVSTSKLLKLKRCAKNEENIVPKKHRIYHISEAMNIEPCTVCKFISKRLFMLDTPFNIIDQNLQILLKYIAPIDILHDLWAFRYPPDVIEHRLHQAKAGEKKKLMPWMIRCPEEKLLKSIKITADVKAIVGDKTSVNYLSDRLKYDVGTTIAIMQKHPKVYNVRVTRMKEILDYLFDAGFSPIDIALTPRIFCHSLQTTKKRLDELKSLGCRPQSLVIVCKSANEYDKFVKNWMHVREQLKEKNIIKE